MLKMTPRAMSNAAANNTCRVPGSGNVIVCAGRMTLQMLLISDHPC